MSQKPDPKELSPLINRILTALSRVLVPIQDEASVRADEPDMLRDCARMVFEMPPLFRKGFKLILRVFNILPFMFGFGFKTFVSLDQDSQLKYVDSWAHSKREVFRETTKAFKGLIMVVCYSNPKMWQMLDYDPITHVKEKFQEREDFLRSQGGSV